MNKEIKQEWLIALRSDEYKQGNGLLKDSQNKFCCLGVLCDVLSKKDPKKYGTWDDKTISGMMVFQRNEERSSTTLPVHLMLELDIPDSSINELISMNDTQGFSFAIIADYIEEKH